MSIKAASTTESSILSHVYGLTNHILEGASLEQSLDYVFENFSDVLPYDRIGFAKIDIEAQTASARWAKSSHDRSLEVGYTAPLKGSSLSVVLARRQPRVLSDLKTYQEFRPKSESTRLILKEGVRSSMTCPLFIRDNPYGFLFFSSREVGIYQDHHVDLMMQVGSQLALLLMISDDESGQPEIPEVPVASAHALWSRPESQTNEKAQQALIRFSALKPGMILDAPIMLSDGRLLLATGVTLTAKSINRLISLHDAGSVSVSSLRIR